LKGRHIVGMISPKTLSVSGLHIFLGVGEKTIPPYPRNI
jgi:hypothetical protein